MSDLISRQDAINVCNSAIDLWEGQLGVGALVAVRDKIAELPSAEPERKKGKWIDKSGGIEGAWNYCSICREQAIDLYDFCPNCGADMRQPATRCTDDYCEREKELQDGFTKWAKSVADSYRKYFTI